MSLFESPEKHAANPPSTWSVKKAGERAWSLVTQDGVELDRRATRSAAERLLTEGFYVDLYDKETRWYAGEKVGSWRLYTPPADSFTRSPRQARSLAEAATKLEEQEGPLSDSQRSYIIGVGDTLHWLLGEVSDNVFAGGPIKGENALTQAAGNCDTRPCIEAGEHRRAQRHVRDVCPAREVN